MASSHTVDSRVCNYRGGGRYDTRRFSSVCSAASGFEGSPYVGTQARDIGGDSSALAALRIKTAAMGRLDHGGCGKLLGSIVRLQYGFGCMQLSSVCGAEGQGLKKAHVKIAYFAIVLSRYAKTFPRRLC
ncbi:Piso0_002139 [Millerozyma farinosa CBS 7064]|uniref:Piso0_002139 protein n=1 Tax=Pichia sorbitophila (strain ATCC MYA-4447 / BCRC 22081 / CBS 7064 / NBRC 10061 / NRRL Y-12695) TaxID=559304 RepID=G8YBT3_PICSO|nr:Piso0_002139 [Millerozyma farinosa CBS 7064]